MEVWWCVACCLEKNLEASSLWDWKVSGKAGVRTIDGASNASEKVIHIGLIMLFGAVFGDVFFSSRQSAARPPAV
jgi:hypothetical protein